MLILLHFLHMIRHQFWIERHFFNQLVFAREKNNQIMYLLQSIRISKLNRLHYEKKLTETLDQLIFCNYTLNFSLKLFTHNFFFVRNQLNISKFLPPQRHKTLRSY